MLLLISYSIGNKGYVEEHFLCYVIFDIESESGIHFVCLLLDYALWGNPYEIILKEYNMLWLIS